MCECAVLCLYVHAQESCRNCVQYKQMQVADLEVVQVWLKDEGDDGGGDDEEGDDDD